MSINSNSLNSDPTSSGSLADAGPPERDENTTKRLRIVHRTEYKYGEPAFESRNELRLEPPHTPWQKLKFFLLTVKPSAKLSHFRDLNDNKVHFFELAEKHSHLSIEAQIKVEVSRKIDLQAFPYGLPHSQLSDPFIREEYYNFLQGSRYVVLSPEVWRFAIDAQGNSVDVFETCYNIMQCINQTFAYIPGVTDATTKSQQALEQRSGVCQDFAHVMLAMCRSLRIPARYVSGYVYDATRSMLRGAQASHAWVEVFILGRGGWFGLDPTNNKVVDENYIVIARGRDYDEAAPVSGIFRGGGENRVLDVTLSVDEI